MDFTRAEGNLVLDNSRGIFMNNSSRNLLAANDVADNDLAVQLNGGCDQNRFVANNLINNLSDLILDVSDYQTAWGDPGCRREQGGDRDDPSRRGPHHRRGAPVKSRVLMIARQEFTLNRRNRWVHSFAGLFALLIAYFGMVTSGYAGFQEFTRTAASITSLSGFVVPLFGLVRAGRLGRPPLAAGAPHLRSPGSLTTPEMRGLVREGRAGS